jgi:signal transduction histidine kinase
LENKESIDIVLLIIAGSAIMFILAFAVIIFVVLYQKKVLAQKNIIQVAENRHQKEILRATVEVAELEREKIAKNIHDDVGMTLNVLKLQLTKISRNPEKIAENADQFKESMGLLDDSISNIRGIARDLMPPTLKKLGFEQGVIELCRQIDSSGTVKVEQAFDFSHHQLDNKTEVQLYRALREVLNNILRHANASNIRLESTALADRYLITVLHNGEGLSSETASQLMQSDKGVGLKSIQSRIQLIRGTLQYLILDQQKSSVSIEIPFTKHEPAN